MPQREEESLLEEMRAAVRGDRERAAARAPKPAEPRPAPTPPPAPAPQGALRRLFARRRPAQ